jgi:hypothetical protein
MQNDRLQRIRERLLLYSFNLEWKEGKQHSIADALSRAPFFPADESSEVSIFLVDVDNPALKVLRDGVGDEYVLVRENVRRRVERCPARLAGFRAVWDSLRIKGALLLAGDRLLVPGPARREILRRLHLSHSGVTKTHELARQLYVWPSLYNDVKTMVAGCAACLARLPSLPHEPVLLDKADFPLHKAATDLFDLNAISYLTLVDRFSGHLWVARLRSTATEAVCAVLLRWFWEFGFPCVLKSDGGPQFRGPFAAFCEEHFIVHEVSLP